MAEARGLAAALLSRGWTPTPAQERAYGPVLSGRHLLLVAPTGSGKTEAALIPLIQRHSGRSLPGIRILYITPLRALNRDLVARLRGMAEENGLRAEVRHGDTPQAERRKQSLHSPDLLLTTPETLQAMLLGRNLRAHLSRVLAVVVDEVHELAGSKRGAQLTVGLERLGRIAGEFQRIGLSATAGTPERLAAFLCGDRECDIEVVPMARDLALGVVRPVAASGEDLALAGRLGVEADLAARLRWLAREVESHPGALIFTNTRQTAEVLGSRLKQMGASVEVHHGSLSAPVRVEAEERFRRGEVRALVCTSSLELGIDIGSVDFVVQYGSPRQVSRLVQRAGRSGHRPGAEARGAVVATDLDDLLECVVIARRAAAGELEPVDPVQLPLDVLANQLAAMLVEGIPKEAVPSLLRRSGPFRDLDDGTLGRVAASLQQAGLRPRGRARRYIVENLSMIPDEKKLELYDLARRKSVGTLDEAFVLRFSEPGSTVIIRGEAWRVVSVEPGDPAGPATHPRPRAGAGESRVGKKEKLGRVLVEPLPSLEGEVPHWEGAEILVPLEVAREVGAVRRGMAEGLAAGRSDREVAVEVARRYPVSPAVLEPLIAALREHVSAAPVPDDRTLLAEIGPRESVLHLCGGHRLNETVGRAVAMLLSARTGSSVALRAEPTRIHLTHPTRAPLRTVLQELRPEHAVLAERALRGTPLALWKTAHVARKFGLLAPGATLDSRAAQMWKGTPVEEEALRELSRERLDIAGARKVLEDLASGRVALKFSGPTLLGRGPDRARELLLPERAVSSILKALEARILRDRVALVCVACGKYRTVKTVASVEPKPECSKCGSRLVAALKPWDEPDPRHLGPPARGAPPKPAPPEMERLLRNAPLVLSYGRDAAFALSARGVGPETAARVLGKHTTGKVEREAMLRDLWEAERNYARTRSFWGDSVPVQARGRGRK